MGIYIAKTLIQDRREVPVRVMKARERVPSRTLRASHAGDSPRFATPPTSRLQDVIEAARSHLSDGEFQGFGELVNVYEDISAVNSEGYGRRNRVYRRRNTRDALPIRQPSRRLPLAKQAGRSKMLDDMQRPAVMEE
jgi:hypothetical protein